MRLTEIKFKDLATETTLFSLFFKTIQMWTD